MAVFLNPTCSVLTNKVIFQGSALCVTYGIPHLKGLCEERLSCSLDFPLEHVQWFCTNAEK